MIAKRNSGEPYRQFLFCMLRKLQLTIASAEQGHASAGAGYGTADESSPISGFWRMR